MTTDPSTETAAVCGQSTNSADNLRTGRPIILTGYTHHIRGIAEFCLPSKQAWAERHGCELIVLRDDEFPQEQGHPSFQKIRWIRDYLVVHDRPVIWLDADSLVTNPEVKPAELLPRYGCGVMTASRDYNDAGRPPHKAWSAGNTAWRPELAAIRWIEAAMQDEPSRWGGLWDQDALQKTQPGHIVDIREPRAMNAVHPAFGGAAAWQPGDFLLHFTGIPQDHRLAEAQKFEHDFFA
jgi:hypothetical protein